MKKRIQFSLALALAAPAWLVTAHAEEHDTPQSQGQMQQQPQMQGQGQLGPQLQSMTADEVADKKLVNQQGEEIGDIDKIVQSKTDGKLNAVVAIGGFLGLGEKQVAVPLDQMQLQQEQLVAQGMTKDQLEQQQAYDDQQYDPVEGNVTLAEAMGMGGAGTQVSFQQLDQDQDGNITKDEAQSAPQLTENWDQYDQDQDGQLNQSEFSAFEQKQQQQQGGGADQVSFQQLDQDQDGNITKDEAQSAPQLTENWDQYDQDQDGQLNQSEFSAFEEQQQQGGQQMMQPEQSSGGGMGMSGQGQVSFQQLDQDQDGNITKDEAQTAPQLTQNWEQYDQDQDGQLNQSEFSAFEQQQQQGGQQMMQPEQSSGGGMGMSGQGQVSFQQLDQDQDGNITRDEAQSAPQLSQNWQQYDVDQDDQISQAEFSAFEAQQQGQQPGQMQQQMPQQDSMEREPQQDPMQPEGQM